MFTTDRSFILWKPFTLGYYWKLYLVTSLILPTLAGILILAWRRNRWAHHPIAAALKQFVPQGSNWHSVASSINVEFRRFDKFMTGMQGRRVIVTDSWVMQTSTYFVFVAHQNDIHLTLEKASQHDLSHEASTGVQYLTIAVRNINSGIKPFFIRYHIKLLFHNHMLLLTL